MFIITIAGLFLFLREVAIHVAMKRWEKRKNGGKMPREEGEGIMARREEITVPYHWRMLK